MDLAQATNAPEVIDFGGRKFPVRQLRLVEWGELQAWLKRALPDPLSQAVRKLAALAAEGVAVDPDLRRVTLEVATLASRDWPPRVGSRRWLDALDEAEGGPTRFVHFALVAGGTPIDVAEAERVQAAASDEEWGELIRIAYLGDPARPKPQAPSTFSTASTTTPTPSRSRTSGAKSSTRSRSTGTGPTGRSGS